MERKFMKGNEAIAEAAVRAGCRFFAGYPITPQNEIPEYLARRLPEVDGVFVQGESEVAAISMVFGAASVGTKAMTSSSGPGISLKTEGISALAAAEIPAVIVNMMRGGPGVGSIQAAQMDFFQATRAMGHGGHRLLVYAPYSVQEAVDLTYKAFNKAEEYRTPVLLCPDGCIGSMMEPVVLPEKQPKRKMEIDTMATDLINPKRKVVTTMLLPEETQEKFNKRKNAIYEKWIECEEMVEEYLIEDAEVVIVAYGTTARVAKEAINNLRAEGVKVGMIRPITLFPFPYNSFEKLDYSKLKGVLCAEMSIPCQLIDDVKIGVGRRANISLLNHAGGIIINDEEVYQSVMDIVKGGN